MEGLACEEPVPSISSVSLLRPEFRSWRDPPMIEREASTRSMASGQTNSTNGRQSRRLGMLQPQHPVCTFSEVGRVWPPAADVFPVRALLSLSRKAKAQLLSSFEKERDLAYTCLRRARWMRESGVLYVTCLGCGRRAWSFSTVRQRVMLKTYRVDRGKRRWRCPADRKHAGSDFCDTTGTPFEGQQAPVGVVLAALYYGDTLIERLYEELGQLRKWDRIRKVLKKLRQGQHHDLYTRLKRYARFFCGTILLTRCRHLTQAVEAIARVEANLRAHDNRVSLIRMARRRREDGIKDQYKAVREALAKLERMDRKLVRGYPLTLGARNRLANEVRAAMAKLLPAPRRCSAPCP